MLTKIIPFLFFFNTFPLVLSQYCTCIPFWQCMEEESDFDENSIIDIRDDSASKSCSGYFDVCCKMRCGIRGTDNLDFTHDDVRKRILGTNNEAKFGEFPWMLGVLYKNNYRCGASLIHPKVALTAAHCLQFAKNGHFKVRAGEYNWDNDKEPLEHQDRLVIKVIVHPQYQESSLRNDIALLLLDRPFSVAENVGIICLPKQSVFVHLENCVAAGWGKNSYKTDSYQSVLKKVDLPIIARSKCAKMLQEARLGPAFILHRSFICAGGKANQDTCKGDGGSPLMCPVAGEENKYEQVGIVSWGLTCGLRATPGVYVNVAFFTSWIDTQMRFLNLDSNVYKY